MTKVPYDTQLTALLVIDPYNDFIYATFEPGRAGEPPERFAAERRAAFRPLRERERGGGAHGALWHCVMP